MRTAVRFNDEARAYSVAWFLKSKGFVVLWDPKDPTLVATSCNRATLRTLVREHPGLDRSWWMKSKIEE